MPLVGLALLKAACGNLVSSHTAGRMYLTNYASHWNWEVGCKARREYWRLGSTSLHWSLAET